MRSSNTQLPTALELRQILGGESQRKAVRYDFLQQHHTVFAAYRVLAEIADADIDWITRYAEQDLEIVVNGAHHTTNALVDLLLKGGVDESLREQLFDKLAIDTEPTESDAIFVFGSPSNIRIAQAVDLFHAGIAPKLIVSGRGPHYSTHEECEADRMAQFAIDAGVPRDAILIERNSITLPDNVKRTLDMFDEQRFQPDRICIVATTYIMRRAYMEWYKFTPWDIEIVPVAATAKSAELQRENWHTSERGIRMLLNEYAKIILEHKMDLIRREDG